MNIYTNIYHQCDQCEFTMYCLPEFRTNLRYCQTPNGLDHEAANPQDRRSSLHHVISVEPRALLPELHRRLRRRSSAQVNTAVQNELGFVHYWQYASNTCNQGASKGTHTEILGERGQNKEVGEGGQSLNLVS